jgi:hypothetical protein
VRGGGPVGLGGRPTPGGRGGLLAAEPALQGALAGQGLVRVGVVGQSDTDVAGAPGGVLLAQGQGLGVERVVGGTPGARPVGGFEALGLPAEGLEQLPDGAGAEAQGAGDGGGAVAAVGPPQDEAAQRQRQGGRHGNPRRKRWGLAIAYSPAAARQNLYVGISGKTFMSVLAA